MTGVLAAFRFRRPRIRRVFALLVLASQAVAIALAPLAEAQTSPDAPTHIEALDTTPHTGHHPGDCVFCVVVRHLSPIAVFPVLSARPAWDHRTLLPPITEQIVRIAERDPDPARAPPARL